MSTAHYVEIEGQFYAPNHPRVKALSRAVARPVGRVEADRPQSTALPALDRRFQEQPSGPRRVCLRVIMLCFRRRLLDPDALAYSCKPLTDALAQRLALDDADPRIQWRYEQLKTDGPEGVAITVHCLTAP